MQARKRRRACRKHKRARCAPKPRASYKRCSLAATRAHSALCLRASAPQLNILRPLACLLNYHLPMHAAFKLTQCLYPYMSQPSLAAPLSPTHQATPSNIPHLRTTHIPRTTRTFQEHAKPFRSPQTFHKLSTHFPRTFQSPHTPATLQSPYPRTFPAHTLHHSKHFPRAH